MVAYYFISPIDAYDINMKIEKHAYETYVKYSAYHPEDKKIAEIAEDELKHAKELQKCNVNGMTNRFKEISTPSYKRRKVLSPVNITGDYAIASYL